MNTQNTETTLPDYKIAANELAAYFATLGLTAEITGAHAAIDEGGHDDKGWAHVAVTVTFTRALVCDGPNRYKATSFATPYKMGVGLVDWKAIAKADRRGATYQRDAERMSAYGSRLTVDAQRRIAGNHLSAFVAKVNAAEVLASCCRDGLDASGQSFEEWAGNYGYDTDSRKAEDIYRACQRASDGVRKLLSHVPGAVNKLAELSSRL